KEWWKPSKDRNARDDNKRTRTGNPFTTATNPVRRENTDNNQRGCTYKEFLSCNPKEYDGKGGSYMVELSDPQMKPRSCCWLVPQLVTPQNKRIKRNGSIKKNPEKGRNGGSLVRIEMRGMITRELGLGILLLQPQTLLGERTRYEESQCSVVGSLNISLRYLHGELGEQDSPLIDSLIGSV
nr:hypothetical protein [Tanacetum cinerariifolium]